MVPWSNRVTSGSAARASLNAETISATKDRPPAHQAPAKAADPSAPWRLRTSGARRRPGVGRKPLKTRARNILTPRMWSLRPKRPNEPYECKSLGEVSGSTRRSSQPPAHEILRRFGTPKCAILLMVSRPEGRRPRLKKSSPAPRSDPPRGSAIIPPGAKRLLNGRRSMDERTTIAGLLGLLLALAGSPSNTARAQDIRPIGKVVTAVGKVKIEHADATDVQAKVSEDQAGAKVGDPVYRGDVIKTGADGRVGINFADDSSFNLSSNASMEMNEFVYSPAGKSNSTLFSLAEGTVTFVAGSVAKTGSMKVDTPVATLGIRGTTPHIEISDDGTVKFATLIEEGKDAVMKRKAGPTVAPPRQRRADRALGICRGC